MINVEHSFKNKFAFPFNYDEIIQMDYQKWFKDHSEIINEVYFDGNMLFDEKLFQDMNGKNSVKSDGFLETLLAVKANDIKISAIFNDIFSIETYQEKLLELFDDKFSFVDILVVPLYTNKEILKKLKSKFFIKNTVIDDPNIEDIEKGIYDDFDMIYVHDAVVQNLALYEKLKSKKPLKIGTITNFEMCYADCPHKRKHYRYIKQKANVEVQFCKPTRMSVLERTLKISNITPLYSQYEKFLDVLDCFKLQGRNESTENFDFAKNIIEMIQLQEKSILVDVGRFPDYEFFNRIPIRVQRNYLKTKLNCTGKCDSCSFCDDIIEDNFINFN